jgi:hypothetical protein
MIPVIPTQLHEGAELVMIAEHQDYDTLPASVSHDMVMSEWEPTPEELMYLMMGGRVRLWQYTCGELVQSVNIEVAEPVEPIEES